MGPLVATDLPFQTKPNALPLSTPTMDGTIAINAGNAFSNERCIFDE